VALILARPDGSVAVLAALYTAPVGGVLAGWALDRVDRWQLLAGGSLVRALKQESSQAQWAAGTLARVNLVAGRLFPVPAAGEAFVIPGRLGGGAGAARHISTGVTAGNRRHGRRGSGRPCGQSGWRHRIMPGS
jgi:hypothetical protein